MIGRWAIGLTLILASAPAFSRNIPGIVVAPDLVLILPNPGAPASSDPRHTKGRTLAQQAVAEIAEPLGSRRLTRNAALFTTAGLSPARQVDAKKMRESMSNCTVEAVADLPSVETAPAQEYYVVQLACPEQGKLQAKMFAAVGLTDQAAISVVLNLMLTPVWSER